MAGWEDYGIDINDIGYFKLNPRFKPVENPDDFKVGMIEAVIEAQNEKCVVTGVDPAYENMPKLQDIRTIKAVIIAKTWELVGWFANHTINVGPAPGQEYNGLQEVPVWSKEEILTYLGEEEKGLSQLEPTQEWVYQQYKILNLLRWTRTYKKALYAYIKDANGATYIEAANNFLNDPFALLDVIPRAGHTASAQAGGGNYIISRVYNEIFLPNTTIYDTVITAYAYFTASTAPTVTFFDADYGSTINTIEAFNIGVINSGLTYRATIGEFNTTSMPEPPDGNIYTWTSRSTTYEIVSKYTLIENGFKFQDNTI